MHDCGLSILSLWHGHKRKANLKAYHEFVTGVASLALNIVNGKNTANMQPLETDGVFFNGGLKAKLISIVPLKQRGGGVGYIYLTSTYLTDTLYQRNM